VIVHTDHQALRHLLAKKDAKPRLIRWLLLLQEYDLQIIDRRGKDNPIADHLSRMEGIPNDPVPINESSPVEYLASIENKDPRYVDYANYLVGKNLPPHFTYHQINKFFNDLKHYYWDDPHLYRHGRDGIIPDHDIQAILLSAHRDPYGGHHAGDRTTAKVLQLGFYTTRKIAIRGVHNLGTRGEYLYAASTTPLIKSCLWGTACTPRLQTHLWCTDHTPPVCL
jgi:hypothetical protein